MSIKYDLKQNVLSCDVIVHVTIAVVTVWKNHRKDSSNCEKKPRQWTSIKLYGMKAFQVYATSILKLYYNNSNCYRFAIQNVKYKRFERTARSEEENSVAAPLEAWQTAIKHKYWMIALGNAVTDKPWRIKDIELDSHSILHDENPKSGELKIPIRYSFCLIYCAVIKQIGRIPRRILCMRMVFYILLNRHEKGRIHCDAFECNDFNSWDVDKEAAQSMVLEFMKIDTYKFIILVAPSAHLLKYFLWVSQRWWVSQRRGGLVPIYFQFSKYLN